jgi:hypothetical protein
MALMRKDNTKASLKRPKIKLDKVQKQYVRDLTTLPNRITICLEYIDLWKEFFRYFAEMNEDKEISGADEKSFFQVMTLLARKHFMFTEMMGDAYDGGNDIVKILTAAVSLNHIKTMQENTLDKLQLDWHNQFLTMNKSLGRLVRLMPESREHTLTEVLASLRNPQSPLVDKKGKKSKAA